MPLTLFNTSMWEIEKVSAAGIWLGRREFEGIWNGSDDEDGAKIFVF